MSNKPLSFFQKTFENDLINFLEDLGLKDVRINHYPKIEDFVEKIICKVNCVNDWKTEDQESRPWSIQEIETDVDNLKSLFYQLQEKFNFFANDIQEITSNMESTLVDLEGDVVLPSD